MGTAYNQDKFKDIEREKIVKKVWEHKIANELKKGKNNFILENAYNVMAGIDPRPRIEKSNRLKNPKYK